MSKKTDNPQASGTPEGTQETQSQPGAEYDPFRPENARLDQSELDQPIVKTELTALPVRKPQKFEFIRVCPDPEYRFGPVPFIEIDREYYMVDKSLRQSLLPREYWIGQVFLCNNPLNKPFLWMIKLHSPVGRSCDWYTSELECAERAMKEWLQVSADLEAGAYTVALALEDLGEPEFPARSPRDILHLGFRRRYVDTIDHPVFARLRGKKS